LDGFSTRWLTLGIALVATSLSLSCGGDEAVATPTPVATVEIAPPESTIRVGETVQLSGSTLDSNSSPLPGRNITWSSSDTQIALVSNSGLVTGAGIGTATITGTSEGRSGTASIEVIPSDFAPEENTELSGLQQFATVAIPAGLTVTVTDDLTLTVDGEVTIAGTLVGDCVYISVQGNSALTVTGTISNSCSDAETPSFPPLSLVGNGAITFNGATLLSRGDITIKNDPTLSEEDFSTAAKAAETGRRGLARASRAGSTQSTDCRIENSSISNQLEVTAGKRGADGTPSGGPGGVGSHVTVFCDGTLWLVGTETNELIAGSGGDGGTGTHQDKTAAVAQGGLGGEGGSVRFGIGGSLQINGSTPTLLQPGPGGSSGGAIATGLDDPSRSKGASATATGLKGGRPGIARLTVGGEILGLESLDIAAQLPGSGGSAEARGANGRNAGAEAAGDGGDATATGGQGGDLPNHVIVAGGFISADIVPGSPPTGLLAGAFGGEAVVSGGDGGEANMAFPNGGAGGGMVANGGQGGSTMLLGADGTLLVNGYIGGGIRFEGAGGRSGWGDCASEALTAGGIGGRGGNASGSDGQGGTGKAQGAPGGVFLIIGTGNGGAGGEGSPPGSGGLGGTDGIVSLGSRVEPGKVFQRGIDGGPCKPDLRVGDITPTESDITVGGPFGLDVQVVNGNVIAGSAGWDVNVFLSTDQTLDSDDLLAGTAAGPELSGGETKTVPISGEVPTNTAPGTYWWIIQLDPSNEVDESDETNNEAVSTAQVHVKAVVPDGTYTEVAVFSQGTNSCGFPTGFTDTLIITVVGTSITIDQPSTGDRNVGRIEGHGGFLAQSTDESYEGSLNSDGSGTAVNTYGSSCVVIYQVVLTPQGG
jgi:Bacterial Ig-like domain (group 2)/CARDB